MRAAIVDDSKDDLQYLYDNISRYCTEHKVHMQIDQFDNEQKFLYAIKDKKYDLVFLDIFMNRIEGDRVARYVREQWANCQIIFTTASRGARGGSLQGEGT